MYSEAKDKFQLVDNKGTKLNLFCCLNCVSSGHTCAKARLVSYCGYIDYDDKLVHSQILFSV